MTANLPMIGFCAYSGTGKTTLLRQIIPRLKAQGLAIAVIKHAHHDFDLDVPGKDSFELRKAGAQQTVICTFTRMASITEFDHPREEPSLQQIVANLDHERIDLVLVEGYKDVRFPKIELHRSALGRPYLYPADETVIALACDAAAPDDIAIPVLDINDIDAIADFLHTRICTRPDD